MENSVWIARTARTDRSEAVRELLTLALGLEQPPSLVYGRHGKPELADASVRISLSHTRGAVACAVSDFPVGLDLEPLDRRVSDWKKLAVRYCTPEEQAWIDRPERLLEIWTRKEALLKRDGSGITRRLEQTDTLHVPELCTRKTGGFAVSFCGTPASFRLVWVQNDL